MWRRYIILGLTVAGCAAIPKGNGKRELQRLVRLPRIEFASPLTFDRTTGFVVFPNEGAAAAEAAEMVREGKGTPADAPLHLEAARIFARGGDVPSSIRSYARAIDLFGKRLEFEPGNAGALIGLMDACLGLGRFAEAQAALDKAALIDTEEAGFAAARFHKEKAWSAFIGEENRFSNSGFMELLESGVRRRGAARIEAARRELDEAAKEFERSAEMLERNERFLQQRAAFRSIRATLLTAFSQVQGAEKSGRQLRRSLFAPEALADLNRLAELQPGEPEAVAVAAFANALGENAGELVSAWPQLGADGRTKVLQACRDLERIADSGSKRAGEAAELLGCARVFLMNDYAGGQRSFREALRVEPMRERSWDLLVLAVGSAGTAGDLVDTCEERVALLPNARSSVMLIKSYDRQGDAIRAELNALVASGVYPHDFYVNLSLAAVLLKREDIEPILWRAGDALAKAEKQMTATGSRQGELDFVVLKGIYFGLSDQPAQARALLQSYSAPEAQEVLHALDY
jgi:tetratricopeptide (TPR) repeat protein